MSDFILETKNLVKQYGDFTAVKGITFSIKRGEVFSLLGPNGAGKTTTISMLSCLLKPSAGDAWVNGHSIQSDMMGVKQAIGVVPQDLALYETLTAQQNLQFWGQMYGLSQAQIQQRSAELLEQVNLTGRANDKVHTFSGGMKRRLNIAVGLLHKPQLVFMDEPTVGIDPQSRRSILDMVLDLKKQGMTVLYTTHYMEEAEELSDRVGIVDHGQLIACGTQQELTQQMGEKQTVRLHVGEGFNLAEFVPEFQALPVVEEATAGEEQLVLVVRHAGEALPALISCANGRGLKIRSIDLEEPNLETVFLHLTGRALRD
jgi:ABC-2 type transport system ATP-binding protein